MLIDSGEYLLSILNDILDISKIDAGKMALITAPEDVRAILSAVVGFWCPRAVAKGVRKTMSKFGARLEPMSHVKLLLAQGRELDIVSQAEAVETPNGRLPAKGSLDVSGLSLSAEQLELLLSVDTAIWRHEAALIPAAYEKFGDRLPAELWDEYRALVQRLEQAARTPAIVAAE